MIRSYFTIKSNSFQLPHPEICKRIVWGLDFFRFSSKIRKRFSSKCRQNTSRRKLEVENLKNPMNAVQPAAEIADQSDCPFHFEKRYSGSER